MVPPSPTPVQYQSVVITSGTLSPIDLYPRILNFQPVCVASLNMTLTRECLCPVVLTRGGDQLPVSTKFDMRSDPQVIRNYGAQQHVVAVAVGSGGMPCHGWLGPSMLGMLWRALPDPARATCTRIDQGSPSSRPMPLPLATISPAPNRRPHAG